jgi:ABC-type uncharacterized transport system permease subunit
MNEVVPFLQLVVTAMVPYILAAQGTMLAGRAGVFNVAQEGVMMLGASVGFLVSLKMGGNPAGLLVAALVGAAFGWFLGWVTTRFRLDQFVIGLALFFAAVGIASLLYKVVIGVTLTPPLINTLPDIKIPLLSEIPGIGQIMFTQDAMVYFAFLISGLLYWMLYRTNLGLKLRSVGENPKAADSLGVSVARTRIWSSTAGGALMALAGAYLPMTYAAPPVPDAHGPRHASDGRQPAARHAPRGTPPSLGRHRVGDRLLVGRLGRDPDRPAQRAAAAHQPHAAHRERLRGGDDRAAPKPPPDLRGSRVPRPRRLLRHRVPAAGQRLPDDLPLRDPGRGAVRRAAGAPQPPAADPIRRRVARGGAAAVMAHRADHGRGARHGHRRPGWSARRR